MKATRSRTIRLGVLAALFAFGSTLAATPPEALDLSLEELLQVDVMTASRKAQRLQDVAAAVFVITREDIERSGATSIPEALRMAPGVQVARLANNRWAVSTRGFNGRFANKLLVLMDGRSLYSPLFSGVLWEAEDTLLEDIDRIEVIRGPGAAMWGANAVNGVINIITRKARDTQGNLLVAGAGTEERAFGALRHGGTAGDGHYRVWGKAFAREESVNLAGGRGNDDWGSGRIGFRGDWPLATGNHLTLSGAAYSTRTGDRWNLPDVTSSQGFQPTDMQQNNKGVHVLGRHEWMFADGSEAAFQVYVDHAQVEIERVFNEWRTTADLDFQHRTRFGDQHDVIWGLGYRHSHDRISSQWIIGVLPETRNFSLLSAFVHDEIALLPDTLRLMLGARLEHNSFTGFEPQPNVRLMWTPTPVQALWGAVSRAVRTPSRAERDAEVQLFVTPAGAAGNPSPLPVLTRNMPRDDHELAVEKVTAFELGYRRQFGANLSLDVAAFHNRYDDLRSAGLGTQQLVLSAAPYIVQNLTPNNSVKARTHGVELVFDWHAAPWWRIQPSYTYLHVSSSPTTDDPVDRANARSIEDSAPRHQLSLRSSMSLSGRQQLDFWVRHAGGLGSADAGASAIPAYTTLDVRYAWRPIEGLELSLVGQNLLDARHPEFVPDLLPSETLQVERGVYFKTKWQF